MRILHCVLILAFAILLKNVYSYSSNPLPNSPLSYLSSLPKAPVPPPIPRLTPKVGHYLLAVQWPPGVCTENNGIICKSPWPAEFKIHGLWPQMYSTSISNEQFNKNKIATITKELTNNWPNLQKNKKDEDFWKAQWDKHGKFSDMGLLAYFNKTLELFGIVSGLKGALVTQKISPGLDYKLQDIEDALHRIYGFSCKVQYVPNTKNQTVNQIKEIRFTFTNDFKLRSIVKNNVPDVRFPA